MLGPRKDFLCKDDIFMGIAKLVAMDSKDPSTQVGSVLVDFENRVIGTGYNGFPRDIPNDALPWDREGKPEDTKYLYVGHAEENTLDNCDQTRVRGSKLYVTLFPCQKCAIRIINKQVSEVVYLEDKYHNLPETIASRKMFKLAGIKIRKFKAQKEEIVLDLRN